MAEEIDLKDHEGAEKQLVSAQKSINFTLSELPVEVLVEKLPEDRENDNGDSDFFIPDYQRKFTWEISRQCKFIESLLMGLPIPFLFGYVDEQLEDRTVIVDGVQRLSTLKSFLDGELTLKGLTRLDKLDHFRFSDLSPLQQRRFKRRTLRMIVLDNADRRTQFELFERINTGSKRPSPAEIRRGAFPGPYQELIAELASHVDFESLTPMGEKAAKQREREELVARLFCYADRLDDFRHAVTLFVNDHFETKNLELSKTKTKIEEARIEFFSFLETAKRVLPNSTFGSGPSLTPRNRFEALAVGLLLSLRSGNQINESNNWITENSEFSTLVKSGGSNSSRKLKERVNYAKDHFSKTPLT